MSTVGTRLLLVDDDPAVRSLLGELLRSQGYGVLEASSAEEVLANLRFERVDGFLLDIDLGGMNGIELCRRIRSEDRYRLCPVIFLTGEEEDRYLEAAFRAGGDDFIGKPFNSILVEARVKGHMQRMQYFARFKEAHALLARYVSEATVDAVESSLSGAPERRPEARNVAICFTDVRGFTAFSEELGPFDLFAALDDCISRQVKIVREFGGYTDKFSGDGLMAVFEGPDKEVRSCLCALRIIESARNGSDHAGRRMREIGIGLHAGRVVIGNIGGEERLDYTVIGSTVNLAARLCGFAEPFHIVASGSIRQAATRDPRLRFDCKRQVSIRGLNRMVQVYDLLSGSGMPASPVEGSTRDRGLDGGSPPSS